MKEKEFLNWLIESGQQENSARSAVSRAKRIEEAYPDLDSRFDDGSIETLLNVFTYTKRDESQKRTPLHKIEIDGNPYTGTQSLRNALTQYIEFLQCLDTNTPKSLCSQINESDKSSTPFEGDKIYKIDVFREWMHWRDEMTKGSANSYISYLNSLRQIVTRKSDGTPVLDLISDLLRDGSTAKALCLLEKVEERVSQHMLAGETDKFEKKDLNNYRSALRKYILFLQDDMEEVPDEEELENADTSGEDLTAQFDGRIDYKPTGNLTYSISDLKQNFIFRLITQNRMSNSKDIFYPIGMIRKLFNYSQRKAKRSGIYSNDAEWLKDWFNDCVNTVIVITTDGDYPLSKINELLISPSDGTVRLLLNGCSKEHVVLTETVHDGKVPMMAKRLRDIHIDHTPLMSVILSENIDNLPALVIMSEIIKKTSIQKRLDIKPSNFGEISKELFSDNEIVNEQLLPLIPKLKNELELLREKCVLKLMQSSYNLGKR